MPKTTKSKRSPRGFTRNHEKRHGQHHKKSHDYHKVYAPYLPLVISIIASLFLSFWHPQTGANTLAYATEMSSSGLLSATNTQRANNSRKALSLNSRLQKAAQAKANHMVAHNYWSHTTPDGQEPWVFVENAGYSYQKAGENLAYGFATSAYAVVGWMNSPTHKANLLDSAFTEVGFGYANSTNFNGSGQQTVVVAMYGKPQVLAAESTQPTAPVATTPAPVSSTTQPSTATPAPAAKKTPKKVATAAPKDPLPITTEQPVTEAAPVSQNIAQAQALTGGKAPWMLTAATILTGGALIALLLHHSLKMRHLWHDIVHGTSRFVLHHPLLESTLLGLIILGVALSRTVGTIL